MNVCSYHLQEAGATPVQELAYSLATAIDVLDAVKESGQVAEDRFPQVVRLDLLLRERRHPLRRGDLQDAGLHPDVGPHRPRALRRHRPEGPPLPLRRAGQQPRPHRGPAREQRAAHRARDARRHALARTPGPARSSCRRGTRPSACPARGTSSGRCACSRCWPTRPTCSSTTTSSTARTSIEAKTDELVDVGAGRARRRPRPRRRLRGHRRAEGPARPQPRRAHAPASSPATSTSSASTVPPRRARRRSAARARS